MNYFINYCSPYVTGIPSAHEIRKSKIFKDIEECQIWAEHLYFNVGCKYVQIIDEQGEIYAEYEY